MPIGKIEPIPVTNPGPGTGTRIKRGRPADPLASATTFRVTCLFATTEDLLLTTTTPTKPVNMNQFRVKMRRVLEMDKSSGIEKEADALNVSDVTIYSVTRVTDCGCLGTYVYRLTLDISIDDEILDDWDDVPYRVTIKRKRPAGSDPKWNVGTAHGKLSATQTLTDEEGDPLPEEQLNAEC